MFGDYEEKAERVPEGIQKLKSEKNIYVYGNSVYAKEMLDILKKFHIAIKGILVSEGFLNEDCFYNYKVNVADDFFLNTSEEVALVAGFNVLVHKQLTEKLAAENKVKIIYVLNGCGILWCNGFKFIHPKVFLVDNYYQGLIKRDLNYRYFKENFDSFLETYNWLEDEKSKKTMEDYLRGHIELSNFPMKEVWETADVDRQYFPEDIIRLSDDEIFVDCGAYTGDTLDSFLKRVRSFKKYYALEPDVRRYDELKPKLIENVIHVPKGAWDKNERQRFSLENECGEIADSDGRDYIEVSVDRIDNIIDENNDKITFIKMDIEGAELRALYGAEKVIKRDRPVLAVCVYHKREDLITIPQYIKKLVPDYKLFLRAHFVYASELVLYAVCR